MQSKTDYFISTRIHVFLFLSQLDGTRPRNLEGLSCSKSHGAPETKYYFSLSVTSESAIICLGVITMLDDGDRIVLKLFSYHNED